MSRVLRSKEPSYFDRLSELQPFPSSAVRLIEAVNDDCVEINELSQLVGNDPAIVAQVLKSANSVLKTKVEQVTSLDEAVISLGTKGIAEIAITVLCGRYLLEEVPLPEVAFAIWRHSLAVSAISDSLARKSGADGGVARMVGILHEVGRLVLVRVAPDRMSMVHEAVTAGRDIWDVEADVLEYSGEEVSVRVASALNLPKSIVALLEENAGDLEDVSPEVRAVRGADSLAPIIGYPVYPGSLGSGEDAGATGVLDTGQDEMRSLARQADAAIKRAGEEVETGVSSATVTPDRAFDALLIANRRLARLNAEYEQTRREVEMRALETRSLADTLAAITMGLDQSALRYSILESLLENYRVDASFLVVSEEGRGTLEGVMFRMEVEGTPDFSPLTVDMSKLTRETRQAIMCGMSVTLEQSEDDPYLAEVSRCHSHLRIAPLMVRGNCCGILGIGVHEGDLRGRGRGDFLEIIAGAAALGLENARLFQSTLREATQDALTGVSARRRILEELEGLCASGTRPLTLMLLDLDYFKSVNDSLGHQQGDRYLKSVAKGVATVLPEKAHMGRYGGDEFLLVFPALSLEEAEALAERIRVKVERVGAGPRWEEVPADLSVTIGLAWSSEQDLDVTQLIGHADDSLYEAKKAGRNRVAVYAGSAPVSS